MDTLQDFDAGDAAPISSPPVTLRAVPWADQPVFEPDGDTEVTIKQRATEGQRQEQDHAALTLLTGHSAGRVYAVEREQTVLGRSRSADLIIDNGSVSRRHARLIRWVGHAYVVEDMGSSNGTFVNGRRVERASLSSSDRIQLGASVTFRFTLTDKKELELLARLYDGYPRDLRTDVYSRDHLERQLRLEVAHGRRHGLDISLVLLSLDEPRVQHPPGERDEEGLRWLAKVIVNSGRIEDLVARYDTSVLAVLLRTTSPERAKQYARRLRQRLHDHAYAGPASLRDGFRYRIGLASLSEIPLYGGHEELMARCEASLKRAEVLPSTPPPET